MKKIKYLILLSITVTGIISCNIYYFSGASIPVGAKTVSVEYFPNKSATISPILSQIFTEELKQVFIEQTNLLLSQKEGDLSFSGFISNYDIQPIAIKSNETAAKNRLTISVTVTFKSSLNKAANFEQTFKRYRDYNSTENISEIEETLINEISKELVEDIFNKAIVDW